MLDQFSFNSLLTDPSDDGSQDGPEIPLFIIVVCVCAVLVFILVCFLFLCTRSSYRKWKREREPPPPRPKTEIDLEGLSNPVVVDEDEEPPRSPLYKMKGNWEPVAEPLTSLEGVRSTYLDFRLTFIHADVFLYHMRYNL